MTVLRLLLTQVRRDRVILPIWIVSTGLLALVSALGVRSEIPTGTDRAGALRLVLATPSLLALRGVPDGPSLGSYVFFQVFCYIAIMAALMSTFMVTRHTRADEERGRLELVSSTPVGRAIPLVVTTMLGAAANLALGVVVAIGFIAGGLEPGGSWIAGVASAATGFAFVGITAVVAQLAPTSRSSNGIAAALVGLAFALRAIGDAAGAPDLDAQTLESAWPSWLSVIGWAQQVFPFTNPNLLPLLLSVGVALATGVIAVLVARSRDLGSSVLPEREGRESGRIHSVLGLAWRQQWPSVVGWAIGGAFGGALAGALGAAFMDSTDIDPAIQAILEQFVGGQGGVLDLLIVAILGICGVLAAMAGAQAVMRARGEESDGRAELVLAGPVSRIAWLLSYVLIASLSAVLVAVSAGLVAGASFLSQPDGEARFWSSLAAGVAQLPAALSFVALTTLLFAVVPRLTVPAGWGLLAVGVAIGQFGGLLNLPEGVRDLSPFTHTPVIPGPDPDFAGSLWLLAPSVVLVVVSIVVVRQRELTT